MTTRRTCAAFAGGGIAIECDEGRVDVGRWAEHRPRDGVETRASRVKADEHRDGAVRLRPRLREEPVRDLALHHHAPRTERGHADQRLGDERCRDVVGQVGDELRRRGLERSEVDGQRVPEHEADVRATVQSLAERRFEPPVELDRVHVPHPIGEERREHAEPGPDLEHDVARRQIRKSLDHGEQVAIDQEVLAECLLRADGHHA